MSLGEKDFKSHIYFGFKKMMSSLCETMLLSGAGVDGFISVD